MAVGLTVDKARQMKQAVDLVPGDLGHFDVWMLQWIRSTKPVTSVFIRPPFGGYYSHQSGCEDSFAVGEERVCDWSKCFQMKETGRVALVNFTDTSKQRWTRPLLDESQVQYTSSVAREEPQLDEGTGPATKRQKRQARKALKLQDLRVGGDAASGASETRPARMDLSEAERRELGDVMATRSERKKKKPSTDLEP